MREPRRAWAFRFALDLGLDVREVWAWPAGLLDEWIAFYTWQRKEADAKARREK